MSDALPVIQDLRPRSNPAKCEIHVGYGCDLACANCNRMSVPRRPHTPDMTVADMVEFLRQCREIGWDPDILLIGGEPTLHPDFFEFCRLAREFKGAGLVQLWTNAYTPEARAKAAEARERYDVSVCGETAKPEGSRKLSIDDIYVSPADYGHPTYRPCWNHASQICGISVDALGYSPCAIGGMIDSVLGVGGRTKRLADLFDPAIVAELTRRLCEHCGQSISQKGLSDAAWREYVEAQKPRVLGSFASPTWRAGLRRLGK
jgi:hypothetical protein